MFDVSQTNNLTLYSPLGGDDENAGSSTSQVVITDRVSTKSLEFKGSYGLALFCGTNKLCLGSNGNLEVYDISGPKQDFLYRISGV